MPTQIKWTLTAIKQGFERFYKEKGIYPTSHEIDDCSYLPSSRQIQRVFGGLPKLRKSLSLDCPADFTKGDHSSLRAESIGARAHIWEKTIHNYLIEKFGDPFVHREYFFSDDRRIRADFFVHNKNGNFFVDVFYPKDRRTLIGCLNSKIRTYPHHFLEKEYPMIFLMVNEEISDHDLRSVIDNKKNKLSPYQHLMNFRLFKEFCEDKTPYSIAKD